MNAVIDGCSFCCCRPTVQEWELLSEVPLRQHKDQQQQRAEQEHEHEAAALAPGSVSITWRGDGLYFATANVDAPGQAAVGRGSARPLQYCIPLSSSKHIVVPVLSSADLPHFNAAGAGSATVRVWERGSGELHAEGEAAAGLLPVAAWQPNGRHLYAAVSKQQSQLSSSMQQQGAQAGQQDDEGEQERQAAAEGIKHVGAWKRELRRRQLERAAAAGPGGAAGSSACSVLLFERNGLQHGGFELPPAAAASGGVIEQLAWSSDSEFLAIVLSEQDEHGEPTWCNTCRLSYLVPQKCIHAVHCTGSLFRPS
jgi:elongator complex protein 1